jgi:hypothetical protein
MNGPLRLVPSKKLEVASLLQQSYECISDDPEWKTTAKRLRDHPTYYLKRLQETHPRPPNEHLQRMMDWASWEIARSALDESIKNSVGLLLYIDKIDRLANDELGAVIRSFNTRYISNFVPGVLYISHLHSVYAGLAFAGFLIRNAKFVVRVTDRSPRWRCINESWVEDLEYNNGRKPHEGVFKQYDGIQGHQTKWLPQRSDNLKKLKGIRETMTYKTERMGGWQATDTIQEVKSVVPDHLNFQEAILDLLCRAVEGRQWDRTYDPSARARPLRSRFEEYKNLAISITGP